MPIRGWVSVLHFIGLMGAHQRASVETPGQTKLQEPLRRGIPFVARVEAAIVYCYVVISQLFIYSPEEPTPQDVTVFLYSL